MAKDIKENRVVKIKGGREMTDAEKKEYNKTWQDMEELLNDRRTDKKTVLRKAQGKNKGVHEKVLSGKQRKVQRKSEEILLFP